MVNYEFTGRSILDCMMKMGQMHYRECQTEDQNHFQWKVNCLQWVFAGYQKYK
jgi:hypothetical protein